MSFKDISYLELWRPFCSAERNHLCKSDRGYHEEQLCEINFNLDQWFRRRCVLKIFLIWSSGGPFVQQSWTICAIFVEGIRKKNSVKLFWICTSGSIRCHLKIFLIWSSDCPFIQLSGTLCANLVEGIMRNNSVKLFWIWACDSEGDAF